MKTEKLIGLLLILGAIGVFIPYTILTIIFEYPDILRQDTGVILTKFNQGGSRLIMTWWAFAILGLPLLIAFILIGQKIEQKFFHTHWVTTIGIIGLVVQIIGLLRWSFIVPLLARNYVSGNEIMKESAKSSFQVLHQLGGVILGEHIGQLFTIIWTIMISIAFAKFKLFSAWIHGLAYISSFIYLLAQAELFATVIPEFPSWNLAGFIGSTLWLIWLVLLGFKIRNIKFDTAIIEAK